MSDLLLLFSSFSSYSHQIRHRCKIRRHVYSCFFILSKRFLYRKIIFLQDVRFAIAIQLILLFSLAWTPCTWYHKRNIKKGFLLHDIFRIKEGEKTSHRVSPLLLHMACYVHPHLYSRLFPLSAETWIIFLSFLHCCSLLGKNGSSHFLYDFRSAPSQKGRNDLCHL